jgi:hypothetical protein
MALIHITSPCKPMVKHPDSFGRAFLGSKKFVPPYSKDKNPLQNCRFCLKQRKRMKTSVV